MRYTFHLHSRDRDLALRHPGDSPPAERPLQLTPEFDDFVVEAQISLLIDHLGDVFGSCQGCGWGRRWRGGERGTSDTAEDRFVSLGVHRGHLHWELGRWEGDGLGGRGVGLTRGTGGGVERFSRSAASRGG